MRQLIAASFAAAVLATSAGTAVAGDDGELEVRRQVRHERVVARATASIVAFVYGAGATAFEIATGIPKWFVPIGATLIATMPGATPLVAMPPGGDTIVMIRDGATIGAAADRNAAPRSAGCAGPRARRIHACAALANAARRARAGRGLPA